MTAEALIEALARGFVTALLAASDAREPAAANPTHRARRRPRKATPTAPRAATTVIPGEVPTPGFDHVDDPLPGFEGIPPATLRDMQAAMDRITKGNEPAPGFYRPEDADQRAPLS